jgi:hypothetical protein
VRRYRRAKETVRSETIGDDARVEMLYAAAEAHPNWKILPEMRESDTWERVAEYAPRAA